jgi:hypothetical protein
MEMQMLSGFRIATKFIMFSVLTHRHDVHFSFRTRKPFFEELASLYEALKLTAWLRNLNLDRVQ